MFRYHFSAQDILFGPGSISQLSEAVDRFHWRRLLLCTTEHCRQRGHLTTVEEALGDRLVAIYEGVRPHVPVSNVEEATALATAYQVEAVVALGGGSVIGTAKAVSLALEAQRTGRPPQSAFPTGQPLAPVVALPTTYAGSEMTPILGTTRLVDGMPRKVTLTDPRLVPRVIVYDPLLTLDVPPRMTAGTGINAVAHCLEALYSITRNPLSTAVALAGLQALTHALPQCYAKGDDVEARTEALMGAFLAGMALSTVEMGLHHGICHVLGGTAGVAHGDANSVMLPHVLRFNLAATAPQLAQAAQAVGLSRAGQRDEITASAVVQRLADLLTQLQLPQRLREIGVREHDLPALAQIVFASRTARQNPQPLKDAAQVETLLHEAW